MIKAKTLKKKKKKVSSSISQVKSTMFLNGNIVYFSYHFWPILLTFFSDSS